MVGTIKGNGCDCRTDNVTEFEWSTNGVCNKVSARMEWIKETMEKSGKNTVEQTTIDKIKKLMKSKFGIFIPLSTPIYM